jgi:predicted amidohydrolase
VNPWIKVLLLATGVAVVVIIITATQRAADDAAWTHLARARALGNTVEALEAARTDAQGTVAEPWISYYLAMALYEAGGPEDLLEARQVASESRSKHPEHSTAAFLERLVAALDSYAP